MSRALTRERIGYALAAIVLFIVEALIALFLHDPIIRPHVGDVLVVVLVHLVLRAATPLRVLPAALTAFAIACVVEIGQWFDLVDALGLGSSTVARIVLGTHFDPTDVLAYAVGALCAWGGERAWARWRTR